MVLLHVSPFSRQSRLRRAFSRPLAMERRRRARRFDPDVATVDR